MLELFIHANAYLIITKVSRVTLGENAGSLPARTPARPRHESQCVRVTRHNLKVTQTERPHSQEAGDHGKGAERGSAG